ncbi:MAG: hypothetical protein RMJ98_09745 [Myxococcales bacterium]|nr:hypothetical protein [Polyangiaceae bacterium]MDW8249571.1 hypothetical protein [Myxococcales bacterium]
MKRLGLLVALALVGCKSEGKPAVTPAGLTYEINSMRWLPPGDDIVYAYKTENLVTKNTGVMNLRLRHAMGDTVELVTSQSSETLRYQDNGILRERTGTLLLKTPPELGAKWMSGPRVTARVVRTGLRVAVEAGTFEGCIEVLEERPVPVPSTITTTFCPDVGIVLIETLAKEPPIRERVELRSFGKAVDLTPK